MIRLRAFMRAQIASTSQEKETKFINLSFLLSLFLRASQNSCALNLLSARLIAQMVPDLIEWVKAIYFCAFNVAVSSMDGRKIVNRKNDVVEHMASKKTFLAAGGQVTRCC